MNTTIPVRETPVQAQSKPARRGYVVYIKRLLRWLGVTLVALVLLGVTFQTVATGIDNRTYAPSDQLYTVNGHQMHMVCMGQSQAGAPMKVCGGIGCSNNWRIRRSSAPMTGPVRLE